ncbi:MAG: type II toxin-antitoxin system prevent-host-death family antitoxin [Gemmatimonadales bacterium]|nr:MAG: type II toxin-antitoxin system prevent-host-death family antitoxin [Gemmatimonadales bacterium]
MIEERVSVGRLKARLSEYLRRAKAGEGVLVTDRGRPVARLVGLESDRALEGRAAELVRSGLAQRPLQSLDADFLQQPRPEDPEGRSLEAVLEERAEGR